jgi:hypothetical protein
LSIKNSFVRYELLLLKWVINSDSLFTIWDFLRNCRIGEFSSGNCRIGELSLGNCRIGELSYNQFFWRQKIHTKF